MASLDNTTYGNALVTRFADELGDLCYAKACPLALMVKKDTSGFGRGRTLNPMVSHSSGSSDFATALAVKGVPNIKEFTVTPSKEYYIGSIDGLTLNDSKRDVNAIASAMETKVLEGTKSFERAISHQIWGNGGGSRGRIAAISTNRITLTEAADLVNFEEGMQIEISSDDGSGASPAGLRAGTPLKVLSFDVDNLYVYMTTNITANYAAAVANDYVFRRGDYANCMKGVLAWIPVTAPTSGDSFFGVDRSVVVNRLAGHRLTAVGSNMEHAAIDAVAKGALFGGEFDTLFLGPLHWAELCKNMDSKVWVDVATTMPGISFKAISIKGPKGDIKIVQDFGCPDAYGLLTNTTDWELWSSGEAPHFAMDDGDKVSREVASDGVEFRMRAWWQLVNKNQKNNVLITWGS